MFGKPCKPEGCRARPLGRQISAPEQDHKCSFVHKFVNSSSAATDTETDNFCSESDNAASNKSSFLYLPVKFQTLRVAALLDTGSSINLISSELFNDIPIKLKSEINTFDLSTLVLANDQRIDIDGTATVTMKTSNESHTIPVYILKHTSNPLILGTQYLLENKTILDFGSLSVGSTQANVRALDRITIEPNTEVIVQGQLPDNFIYGHQGVCSSTKDLLAEGIIASKALVTVSKCKRVPVKLLNPGNTRVIIPKGKRLVQFTRISPSEQVLNMSQTGCNSVGLSDKSVSRVEAENTNFEQPDTNDTSQSDAQLNSKFLEKLTKPFVIYPKCFNIFVQCTYSITFGYVNLNIQMLHNLHI